MDEMGSQVGEIFPLTAVVGHQEAKRAIILALINPGLNLLIWGDGGLGKRTMLMGASSFLPKIRTTGCHFNCDPRNKNMQCSRCLRGGWREMEIRMPFSVLPYNIDRDRLLGISDIDTSFLGRANRGIIAIRNLENHDKKLIMEMFSIIKEKKVRMGKMSYPTYVQVMATNTGTPGTLIENFALKVHVHEIDDIEERIEIVRRVEDFRKDSGRFRERYRKQEEELRKKIEYSRNFLKMISVPTKISEEVKNIVKEYGLREDYRRWILMAATANAAYEERLSVGKEDLEDVFPLVISFNP